MSESERQQGMKIIKNWVKEIDPNMVVEIPNPTGEYFSRGIYPVVLQRGNKEVLWEVTEEDMEDLPGDKNIQRKVRIDLEGILSRHFSPEVSETRSPVRLPSIFLAHSSVDNQFVWRLAEDLKRNGVRVWFDEWEIKVGDSLIQKIEKGIHSNEYLGVVLSPDAVASQWVQRELDAGHIKEIEARKVVILPILYRTCDIPPLLKVKKYADCRMNYKRGLEELLQRLLSVNSVLSPDQHVQQITPNRTRRSSSERIIVSHSSADHAPWIFWVKFTPDAIITATTAEIEVLIKKYTILDLSLGRPVIAVFPYYFKKGNIVPSPAVGYYFSDSDTPVKIHGYFSFQKTLQFYFEFSFNEVEMFGPDHLSLVVLFRYCYYVARFLPVVIQRHANLPIVKGKLEYGLRGVFKKKPEGTLLQRYHIR